MKPIARLFLITVLVVQAVARAADRPNVLFIFNDDQRADTIAALDNPVIKTPSLDRLCRQGLSFTRAYMQCRVGSTAQRACLRGPC